MEEERKNSLCPSVHCDQQEETEGREDGSLFSRAPPKGQRSPFFEMGGGIWGQKPKTGRREIIF